MSDKLIQAACDKAILAAGQIVKREVDEIDYELLSGFLREECKRDLPQALEDAQDAVRANMGQVASATLAASMNLCGINAANRYLDHVRLEATR